MYVFLAVPIYGIAKASAVIGNKNEQNIPTLLKDV
jgi:hypothetical protein